MACSFRGRGIRPYAPGMTTGTVEDTQVRTTSGSGAPVVAGVEQVRRLVTEVPGPASAALRAQLEF